MMQTTLQYCKRRWFSIRKPKSAFAATYDPVQVEKEWNSVWKYHLENADSRKQEKSFSMILPPPNVTGVLHIGHALNITIQDILARWHRMRGFNVRWIPGLDHAGIATQTVVEKQMFKDSGQTKYDIGRDAFVDKVWEWRVQHGDKIKHQLMRLGASLNWEDEYFTLDEARSKAVEECFIRLHEEGMIFRQRKMINWCVALQTAISDVEVDLVKLEKSTVISVPNRATGVEFGVMHRFKYYLENSDEYVLVDTTRPETILGDTAIAIHPNDDRYKKFHGKKVLHPFSGKALPIVLDEQLVNMELGTGVVKITPAHDANDYECARRHGLDEIVVFDKAGKTIWNLDAYAELNDIDRFDCRNKVIEILKSLDLYVDKMNHETSVSVCSRSGDVIEPMLQPQWFVNMKDMANQAKKDMIDNTTTLHPNSQLKTWNHWLDNIQDWCISRQLWWGHRLPVYRVLENGKDIDLWIAAKSANEAQGIAEEKHGLKHVKVVQDEDVLDTWFSSALLPLSAFGWPDTIEDRVHSQYPLSVLETGQDILFFWVARMSMLCTKMSGVHPFKDVLLHPIVRDKAGRKMSKSIGNVIDPIHVIDGIKLDDMLHALQTGNLAKSELKIARAQLSKDFPDGVPTCGTDALRFTLASYMQQGRQINLDMSRVIANRHFCNKIWNAVRYSLANMSTVQLSAGNLQDLKNEQQHMGLADLWILGRLAKISKQTEESLERYQIGVCTSSIYDFILHDLCDVYLEFCKPRFFANGMSIEEKNTTRRVLFHVVDSSLRLLHPFMPFVTEELWQHLQNKTADGILMNATFPEYQALKHWKELDVEDSMEIVKSVLHAVRSLRHTGNVLVPGIMSLQPRLVICTHGNESEYRLVHRYKEDIVRQCKIGDVVVQTASSSELGSMLMVPISTTSRAYLSLPRDADMGMRLSAQMEKLERKIARVSKAHRTLSGKLENSRFLSSAPTRVIEQEKLKAAQLQVELDSIRSNYANLLDIQRSII